VDHRAATGQGQHIELSQLEVGTYLSGPALIDYFATGREATSQGNRDPFADHAVNDVFPCADGRWLAVTVPAGDQWDRLRRQLDVGDGLPAKRMARWASGQQAVAAVEHLQSLGVAAGLIADAEHLTTVDPQLQHRRWLRTIDSEMVGTQTLDRHPGRWHGSGGDGEIELTYRASPYLGQHNFEVYGELVGWVDAQVAEALGDELLL
jgi:crotonobetainyl-CoA:carnitine CoA-transferase CaiB-like acyl-CoA transferase